MLSSLACAIFLTLVSAGGWAQESRHQVPRGFTARVLIQFTPNEDAIGGIAVLPEGRLAIFDGKKVAIYDGNGLFERNLFTPEESGTYGNYLRLSPDGSSLYFGINMVSASPFPHYIYRISLDPGSPGAWERVDSIRFNYDFAFDASGRGLVSALEAGNENRIYLLDGDPETPSDAVVTGIPGYSGPIAFHDGKLYCATAVPVWPPQEPINRIVYFTEAQLEEGIGEGKEFPFQAALDLGQIVIDGVYGYFNMAFIGDRILASNSMGTLDWISQAGAVEVFLPEPASFIAFRPGSKDFRPGAGPKGGVLYANFSDYSTYNDIVAIAPELFFRRGYINSDGRLDISDAIELLGFLFLGGQEPEPLVSADLNDDGGVDVSDPVYLLAYLFTGGQEPPEPFLVEGPDPTP